MTFGSHLLGVPKGWATPANSYSGWSKRASRVYSYHGWNEDLPRPGDAQPETWADVEVEIVDEQNRSQGQTSTTEATDRKAAGVTGSSSDDAATDKEAAKRRLSELHRLLNSRKGA